MCVEKRRRTHQRHAGEGRAHRRSVWQEQPVTALPGLLDRVGEQPAVVLTAGGG